MSSTDAPELPETPEVPEPVQDTPPVVEDTPSAPPSDVEELPTSVREVQKLIEAAYDRAERLEKHLTSIAHDANTVTHSLLHSEHETKDLEKKADEGHRQIQVTKGE